jgi:hypothetical protein
MVAAPFVTNAVAVAMATAILTAMDAGTAAVVEIYSGTAPADADASITGTLLASLTCSATSGTVAASGNFGRITLAAITPDSSADNTGTATHFRIKTQTGGTVVLQGAVGTSAADMILNTVAITAGSTVSLSSGTIDVPE